MPEKYLVIRGVKVGCPFQVHGYGETGFEFVGRERTHTRCVVLHWTGAENPPAAMYNNMLTRSVYGKKSPLSVHFCVDQRGDIYQMADAEMRAAHAVGKGLDRSANSFSIGIEFVGRGSDLTRPSRGYTRERVTETIHGQKVRYDDLLDVQVASGVKLVEKLCNLYDLPMRVPEEPDGDVLPRALSDAMYDTFRGVVGHYHVEPNKYDPGLKLLRAVQRRGRELDARVT